MNRFMYTAKMNLITRNGFHDLLFAGGGGGGALCISEEIMMRRK